MPQSTPPTLPDAPESAPGRLLSRALSAFARHGFDGASTREIALSAGVQQGLVGYHFGSKEGLWRAVVDAGFARLRGAFEAECPGGLSGRRLRVRCTLEHALRVAATEPELLRIVCHAAFDAGPRLLWLRQRHLGPLGRALLELRAGPAASAASGVELERALVGWLAAHVALGALFVDGDGRVELDAALHGWLDLAAEQARPVDGAWSLAAARRRARTRAQVAP